jgi:cell division protein FtsQ
MGVALVAVVLIAATLLGGIGRRLHHAITDDLDSASANAGFGIADVHISGNARTPPDALVAALGLEPGQSIFEADLQAARQRLLALDWVADADVRRRYPGSIYVTIVEKRPFALWQAPSGLFVIERSGGTITSKNLESFASLPKLIGPDANTGADIVDAVAQHRAVLARVKAMERVADRRWNLILDDGVIVKLPEDNWQKQIATLEHLIVDKAILERDVTEIDLRNSTNYFFLLKSGEKKDIEGGKPI